MRNFFSSAVKAAKIETRTGCKAKVVGVSLTMVVPSGISDLATANRPRPGSYRISMEVWKLGKVGLESSVKTLKETARD